MTVELTFDRIIVTVVTVHVSAFEGGGQEQVATVWLDERQIAMLKRRKSWGMRWQAWHECKWLCDAWLPVVRLQGGLLEFVSIVRDLI